MRLFLVAAIVLIVLALIAAASATGLCLGSSFSVWLAASLLAYFVNLLLGDRFVNLYNGRRRDTP